MSGAVRVRLARVDDAAAIAAIYAPIVTNTAISFEEIAPDASEFERRIAALGNTFPWLVADDGRGVAGYAYACAHRARAAYRWSVDVSAYVHERARRRGIAAALYRTLFRMLARQGFRSAFAGIALPNVASVALHRSLGFVDVGVYPNVGFKAGAWRDVMWFARPLLPPDPVPAEPRAVTSLEPSEIATLLEDV